MSHLPPNFSPRLIQRLRVARARLLLVLLTLAITSLVFSEAQLNAQVPVPLASEQAVQPIAASFLATLERPDVVLSLDNFAVPAWTAERVSGMQIIDDFEDSPWPDHLRWPLVADLNAPYVDREGYSWAPSHCEAESGTRALRAVGGGDGAMLGCDAAYPPGVASSALLALDLSPLSGASSVDLVFDLWVDTDPDEGLIIHWLLFADDGAVLERRIVYSATGRVGDWARAQRLDLTRLRDARSSWEHDMRGERAYIEFLFVSTDGGDGGARGILLDDLSLAVAIPAATATPTPLPPTPPGATATATPGQTPVSPTPVERTSLCDDVRDCNVLDVRAWIDHNCDGRFQTGYDAPVRTGEWVSVMADDEPMGTALGRTGRASFRFPPVAEAHVWMTMPDGYEMCPGSANPAIIEASNFNMHGRAALDFRLRRER